MLKPRSFLSDCSGEDLFDLNLGHENVAGEESF